MKQSLNSHVLHFLYKVYIPFLVQNLSLAPMKCPRLSTKHIVLTNPRNCCKSNEKVNYFILEKKTLVGQRTKPVLCGCLKTVEDMIIIIIIIISYFNWVAISQRLLLRPPVSHTLTHTHNQIKSNSNYLVAAVGHLLSCPRLVAGGCREKNSKWHTGGVVPSVQCLTDFSANLLSHQHPPWHCFNPVRKHSA